MRVLIYAVVALLLTSCLELEQTLTINADGSGSQVLKMSIPKDVLAEMELRASAMNPMGAKQDLSAIFAKEKVGTEVAKHGLSLLKHESKVCGRRQDVEVKLGFKNLAQLRQGGLAQGKADLILQAGEHAGTIRLIYYPTGQAAYKQAQDKARQVREKGQDPMLQEFFKRQKKTLPGLDLGLVLNLPGIVVQASKNMQETGLRQVTAKVKAADIRSPSDLILALAPRYEVVFYGKECTFPLSKAGSQ